MAPWAITEARYGSVGPSEVKEKLQALLFAGAGTVFGILYFLGHNNYVREE